MSPRVIQVMGITPRMITKPKLPENKVTEQFSDETLEKILIIGITALSCIVLLITTIWLRSCIKLSSKSAPMIDMKQHPTPYSIQN